ncbi:hypothetical protein FRC11_014634 [Ceratobasidium sp. 423]|nr:hypothetical protein FRC11_014634 [Ceratobasidium sp. 423]
MEARPMVWDPEYGHPTTMSKKQTVNATSFFDLKAELAKHEDAFAKSKLSGKGKAEPIVGGGQRPDKKKPTWARENKGVRDRARRDAELDRISQPTLESARAKLERKAKLYDQLQKGQGAGLSEKQRESLLFDFDSRDSGNDTDSSGDRDRDESLVVPGHEEDDPIIEYEDEFGRIRTARRSEVPRDRLPENTNPYARSERQVPTDDDPDVVYTVIARAEVDTALAQVEAGDLGPAPQGSNLTRVTSRAVAKRQQELEERREMLDAKRRKMLGPDAAVGGTGVEDFLASLEKELFPSSTAT